MENSVLVTLKREEQPTLAQISKEFNLKAGEIDESFGVIPIDPSQNLYCILMEEKAAQRIAKKVEGVFPNSKISPFNK